MCFAPEADVVGGIVITAIGVDACRNLRGRSSHLLLATLPLLLGVHQLIEAFVWWGLQGQVPWNVGRVAMWMYLVIAFVVLPVFVPLAVRALEPTPQLRLRMIPFALLGAGVSTVLLASMLGGPVSASLRPYHLDYNVHEPKGLLIVALYIVATCGSLLVSGYRHILVFGVANLVGVGVIAWLTFSGFASVWCAYAAVSAGLIAAHMRFAKPHRAAPYLLT